ncbi:MAG: phytoene desaturase [Phycisphaeraceae bacterium]|nr:phytoene desaturase [Phycisphaeraceae bacterium]
MSAADRHEVAVVGAGPGGLASAMLLAAAGARVRVFESMSVVGGRTSRITLDSNRGQFAFDRGPTFFLMPYVLEEIFAATGRTLTDYADLTRLDPMYRLIMGRGQSGEESPLRIDTTQDVSEMARRIAAIDPRDGANFERFIRDTRTKLRLMEPILRSPMRGVGDVVAASSARFLPHLSPHLSVDGLLSTYFRNPHVRMAVSFQSKYLGMSPLECPSLFSILPFIEYEYGIWHPRGGCNALMHAMADVCREMGVEFRFNSPIAGIEFDGARATGIRLADGSIVEHGHVVVNADASAALKRFIPEAVRLRFGSGLGGASDQHIDSRRYSCSTYMLYLGIDGAADLPHHTIYISSDYRQNLEDITTNGVLSRDPSVYVCNPTPLDPTLAPCGCTSLYVLMPTPNTRVGSIDWRAESLRVREVVLEQLERRFGIADIEQRIVVEKRITPLDWRDGADGMGAINFGATFNLAHNLMQMLHRRVAHKLEGLDGVWFVGGGTHPGSGLPVIFLSAQIGARMLAEELGLPAPRARPPARAFAAA